MSNRIKITKHKDPDKVVEKKNEQKETKHAGKFLKEKQEKGTTRSNFSGKSTKEYSRKKT